MRYLLLGALLALAPTRALAGGAFVCTDACSRDPRNGTSCLDLNMGCNPITRFCVPCVNDSHCAPGGTCVDSQCLGVVCSYDAGPDAGDVGAMDVEGVEGPIIDSGMDAEIVDAEVVDSDVDDADARSPTDPLPGARGTTPPKEPFDGETCGCTTTSRSAGADWILCLGLLSVAVVGRTTCKRRLH